MGPYNYFHEDLSEYYNAPYCGFNIGPTNLSNESTWNIDKDYMSRVVRKHKPGCTTTEDGKRLEISDLEVEGLFYLCSKNKGTDQLCSNGTVDLCLCFHI